MSAVTPIEWTDRVWNPLRGCSLKSPGCTNCYAMRVAWRFGKSPGQPYYGLVKMTSQGPKWTGDMRLVPGALGEPLSWVAPSLVFVNSMSDLFHEDVPFEFIASVFAVMSNTTRHRYQVLTKRADRMLAFLKWVEAGAGIFPSDRISDHWPKDLPWKPYRDGKNRRGGYDSCGPGYPFENVLLGCSVENQQWADARRPAMEAIAARGWFTWVSYEPALGPVDWEPWRFLRWLVSGGESGGSKARPTHPEWHRAARDFCDRADIRYHFKQWGEWLPAHQRLTAPLQPGSVQPNRVRWLYPDGSMNNIGEGHPPSTELVIRLGKKNAGRLLDGFEHNEVPRVVA